MPEFVYGHHAVAAVLEQAPKRATCLWLSAKHDTLAKQAKAAGVPCKMVSRSELEKQVPEAAAHQGLVLEVKPASMLGEAELDGLVTRAMEKKGRVTILALDEVQDPRNLGACLRSAAAYGVDAVIVPKRRSALLTSTAEKVACGGAVFVPVIAVTNLVRSLKSLQQLGLWVVGTALETDQSLSDVDLTGNTVLVMGSEGEGVRQLTAKTCDYLAKIPMQGALQSLNVSAATTVCLYEQLRQLAAKG
jgi:23S rRNA (guanosine2251-2'-O)-methyltransferase